MKVLMTKEIEMKMDDDLSDIYVALRDEYWRLHRDLSEAFTGSKELKLRDAMMRRQVKVYQVMEKVSEAREAMTDLRHDS